MLDIEFNMANKLTPAAFVLFCLVTPYLGANVQNRNSFGQLQRSQSDSVVNRTFSFHRRPSYNSYRDSCKTNYKFDYIQLSLMWPPGFCSTSPQECKRVENRHFTVHGMWPTIRGTQEPSNCCFDNTFDYKSLESILPTLNEYWYSYYELNNNRKFWSHEWLKHGTCSRDIPRLRGEVLYFGTTVQLAKQLPILESLANATIVPNNQKAYKSDDIAQALRPVTQGKLFQIDCDYEHHQPTPVLKGLNFCFNANLELADCPEMKRKCQRQVIFPAEVTHLPKRNS